MADKIYIYPKKIQTSTGQSIEHNTQKITNPSFLCSSNQSLAYWGVKNPTYVGNYLRNYYDSVTSITGSYYKPEPIYAISWDIDELSSDDKINSIIVQYKWEQISYSCGTNACYGDFDKPTISIIYDGKVIASGKGSKPDAVRYNNNQTNEGKMNVNSAELSTLHSQTFEIPEKYNLTAKKLKDVKIKFAPAKNTSHNHCRIVMQFLRMKVDYTPYVKQVETVPNYRINSTYISAREPDRYNPTITCNSEHVEFSYFCSIRNSNKYNKNTTCKFTIPDDITVIEAKPYNGDYDYSTNTWNIPSFKGYKTYIQLICSCSNVGSKKIIANINQYADSINRSKECSFEVKKIEDSFDWNVSIDGDNAPYIYNGKDSLRKRLRVDIHRICNSNRQENVIIDTQNWITENIWRVTNDESNYDYNNIKYLGEGKWEFKNIIGKDIAIISNKDGAYPTLNPGEYHITVTHQESRKKDEVKNIDIYVTYDKLPMDYFKLRLEDGSDIRYNSFIVSEGDDLQFPITYEPLPDNLADNITIYGEDKRIPVSEARYVTYTIDSKVNLKNVLCEIEVIGSNYIEEEEQTYYSDSSEIIIGVDNQAELLTGIDKKFCVINEIKADESKKIQFIVQSDMEQDCTFKLNLLGYSEKYETKAWKPANIIFKDVPNVKLSIDVNDDDLSIPDNDTIEVQYIIENQSMVDGTDIKFQLKEPSSFKVQNFVYKGLEVKYALYQPPNEERLPQEPIFDPYKRIITFPTLWGKKYSELQQSYVTQKHILKIVYKVTQKGIYNLKLETLDDKNTFEDDQQKNSTTKRVIVDTSSKIKVKTSVNNNTPFVNELIDYKISFKNYIKSQDNIKFIIKDIGNYDDLHETNDYKLEYDLKTKGNLDTKFNNNNIGIWKINQVDVNEEQELTLTLRPQQLGYHIIEATLIDNDGQKETFSNIVNVLEPNKQIDFNVYHAVGVTEDTDCSDFDNIIEICDDDYIDLGDTLFYVCEVKNNNRNTIEDTTHIYIRLDDSFLDNDIICSTHNITRQDNNLLHIRIPQIGGCQTEKICFKVQPSKIGTYISNFMLSNRNAHIYHKKLTINVDTEFNQKKLEHEITIYNFEKTNHYFRYELDGNNDIFKFFNRGADKSLRLVDIENYENGSIETYRGSNIKKLIRDISNNSKYVEPELLNIGNNKLAPKGYEIYPDGFIRRFGLLNSEVFHYTGQLPTISFLVDKAMRWNQDNWDEKFWAGDDYDNGVFDLTIDYNKIPTNFNILEVENPIKNLQALVDKTKPYGTKALCYYSTKLYLDLKVDAQLYDFEIGANASLFNKLKKLGLISLYHKHDKSIAAIYDLFEFGLKTDMELYELVELSKSKNKYTNQYKAEPYNNLGLATNTMLVAEVFDQQYSKKYINECYDIVNMLYSHNPNISNIDIIKDYNYKENHSNNNFTLTLNKIYSFEYTDKDTTSIFIDDKKYEIKCIEDDLEQFIGFKITQDDKELFSTNFYTNISKYNIQIQMCDIPNANNKYIIHIFSSINEKPYVHIGYIIIDIHNEVIIQPNEYNSYSYDTNDQKIKFRISDNIKTLKESSSKIVQFDKTYKWKGLDNITNNNKYAYIENNIDIDKECKETEIKTPTIGLKYDKFNLSNQDEIIDIGVKIKAKTNKENFLDDVRINLYQNGDYYIPENNIARKIYYPQSVQNMYNDYVNTIFVQQPNITICSHCMHTHIGLLDYCPHCQSDQVSQYDEKKSVTICRNPECEWITDDWHDYCPHCLSKDVEKTKVDFNKTYCFDCQVVFNDYYPVCPKCGKKNIVHTNKDEQKYVIAGSEKENIDKITIHSDTNRVNICNLEIKVQDVIDKYKLFDTLKLHLKGQNYNDGHFYYCPSCEKIFLDNHDHCPYCNNKNIEEYSDFNNTNIYVYIQDGTSISEIKIDEEYGQLKDSFDVPIDILSIVDNIKQPSFSLLIYAENLLYDNVNDLIEEIDTDEESYDLYVNNLPVMNLTLDNIYYEQQYKGETEWEGLDKLQYANHTGIKYNTDNEETTRYIRFDDFDIQPDEYNHLYLTIAGINKSSKHISLTINVNTKNTDTEEHVISGIEPDLFEEKIDLFDFMKIKQVQDISVQIQFTDLEEQSEIIITHVSLTTEKEQNKNILYGNTKTQDYNITKEKDTYLFTTYDIFNMINNHPFYIDNRLLDTNLVCYLDFGYLHNQEYIRLYDAELVILYKNKYGKMITEYTDLYDEQYDKQLSNAKIQKNDAEIWGAIQTSVNTLNNLESQIFNNVEEEDLQSTSLKKELLQSFTTLTNDISQIRLNYDGYVGYPSDMITVQIFDDYQNKPDNLLFSNTIMTPSTKDEMCIDVNLDNIPQGKYWIKLIDKEANDNNYHKFCHNRNLDIGNLIIQDKNGKYQYDENKVLSFAVDSYSDIQQYYNTPTTIDVDNILDFKTCYTLYRYNTQSNSNAYISDIKNELGYLQYTDQNDIEIEDTYDAEELQDQSDTDITNS